MTQTSDPAQLLQSRALLHGIHSMFPLPQVAGHNGQDPIFKKKLESGEGQWAVRKEVLGWMVDCTTRCIKLARDKQRAINAELHNIVRMTKGVPFKRIEKLIGKILTVLIFFPLIVNVHLIMMCNPKIIVIIRINQFQASVLSHKSCLEYRITCGTKLLLIPSFNPRTKYPYLSIIRLGRAHPTNQ